MSILKPINLEYLKNISGGDDLFFKESVEMATILIPSRVAAINQALKAHSYDDLYQAAHKMKSTARMIGMPCDLLEQIEHKAQAHSPIDELMRIVREITLISKAAVRELRSALR